MYANRLDRVRARLAAHGLQNVIVSDPNSILYLCGASLSHVGERLFCLLVPVNGKATLFFNALYSFDACDLYDVCVHSDTDVATAGIAARVRPGVLGVDKFWPCKFLLELMDQRPDLVPKIGSVSVDEARMVKDEAEQAAMRLSSSICDKAFEAIPGLLREGMTEKELSREMAAVFMAVGDPGRDCHPMVCFGAGSAEPHHTLSDRKLQRGDTVLVDAGQCSYGYYSDVTRTFFYDSITEEQKNVYEIVLEANRLGREAVRPGVPLREIDRVVRDYITSFGYGPYFTHRTGHNIGMQGHEWPDVSQISDAVAEPGMVFSIEPGIYLPGKFGVRIEDLVMVTETGCDTLNACSKAITVVSASCE
ncbi:MAG: aminopeptidase P family protein [Clostridia bacterium]|nr:aminopeptidase P family protein [Clostridia bacterium]